MDNTNGYVLTSKWFNFAAENSEKVECKHTATYLYIVEQFNKRNWVEVIGLPTDFTMTVLNIGSYKTYKKVIEDLIEFGFIKMVEKAKNQSTSNKIALVKNTKADTKAIPKHILKQVESECHSTSSIDKLLNIETIKLLENNASLVNEKLSEWIEDYKRVDEEQTELKKYLSEQFDIFWNYYNKGSKVKTRERFMKLTRDEFEQIKKHLKLYFAANPEKKFRKDAERYISHKLWETEIQQATLPENWFNMDLTPEQMKLVPPEKLQEKKRHDVRRQMGI